MRRFLIPIVALGFVVAACGGAATDTVGVEKVQPAVAGDVMGNAPEGLVVLDIRTPEEFAGGHLPGAVNLDFYAPDFSDRLAELDKTVPYVMYCRSGNRSATAATLMRDLDFEEVYEIDGGILAWAQGGGSIVAP